MEVLSPTLIAEELFAAAKDENWDEVDERIIPQLSKTDGNMLTNTVLQRVSDEDPNIRDAVATALSEVVITDDELLKRATEAMVVMTQVDKEKFPAGRAAVFLLQHQDDKKFGAGNKQTLELFKHRVGVEGWIGELRKEIPELQGFLGK